MLCIVGLNVVLGGRRGRCGPVVGAHFWPAAPLIVPPLLSRGVDTEFVFALAGNAPLEPDCAIADVRGDRAEIWASLKVPIVAQSEFAAQLGLQVVIMPNTSDTLSGAGERGVAPAFAAVACAYARATGTMPTYFPINHNAPLGFTPLPLEPSTPQSPTDGWHRTRVGPGIPLI
jgi:hypothetical protein